jgi:hypothetical protein
MMKILLLVGVEGAGHMKISADILALNLRTKYTFKTIGELGCDLVLERPLFWGSTGAIRDHQIYMANSSHDLKMPESKVSSVLLCVGEPAERYSGIFETILIFEDGVDVFSLYNCVQEIYSEHEAWDFALQEILNSGRGIQAMLDCSERIFLNPLLVSNKNMITIAYSAHIPDRLLDEDVLTEFTSALKMNPEFNTSFEKKRATIFPDDVTGIRSMYVNIFYQGIYQYRLLINETVRKFLPSDGAQLEHLARYIQLALNADTYGGQSELLTLSHTLKGIISGEITDASHVSEQLGRYCWNKTNRYFCMKIQIDAQDIQNNTVNFLTSRVKKIVKGSCAFEYENAISVFVNLDIFSGSADDAVSELVCFLRDSNLKAGISDSFSGYNTIRQYYKQADLTLSVGSRRHPHIWIHRYRDIVEDLIIDSCTSQLPARMLCAPELIKLKNYDKANGTQYYLTLYTYLKNGLHKVQTAEELFIHRSTFLYRLDRIHELTGLDYESNSKQWYLLLSFKLLEVES